jgi:DNA-binding MurR/RpiR family transcriptional regulator
VIDGNHERRTAVWIDNSDRSFRRTVHGAPSHVLLTSVTVVREIQNLSILKQGFQEAGVTSVEVSIHDAMQQLTSAEKRAARALLGNYPTTGLGPVAEFATQAGVSAATVLRFVAQLGYGSYPEFQRALRRELEERVQSPLRRGAEYPPQPSQSDGMLAGIVERAADNLRGTASRIPTSEFDAVCRKIAEGKGACYLSGGRFTDPLARYMEAHLRVVRPNVRRLEERPASRRDQLLDIHAGDIAILFDVRRYDPQLVELARELKNLRAFPILVTDEWISPVSRYAKIVLPCQTAADRVWDSNVALFVLVEAIIARTTELTWPSAEPRIARFEPR